MYPQAVPPTQAVLPPHQRTRSRSWMPSRCPNCPFCPFPCPFRGGADPEAGGADPEAAVGADPDPDAPGGAGGIVWHTEYVAIKRRKKELGDDLWIENPGNDVECSKCEVRVLRTEGAFTKSGYQHSECLCWACLVQHSRVRADDDAAGGGASSSSAGPSPSSTSAGWSSSSAR